MIHDGGLAGIVRAGPAVPGEPQVTAAGRPVVVTGTDDLVVSDPAPAGPARADLSRALPPGTVLLRVLRQPEGERPRFRLEFHDNGLSIHSTSDDEQMRAQERPRISLAQLARDQDWTGALTTLRAWSLRQEALIDWLDELLRRFPSGLRLIVWDRTGWEIPWEMVYVNRDSAVHGWLGADVELIRWMSGREPAVREHHCQGPILSFVDPDVSPDPDVFGSCLAENRSSMEDLVRALTDRDRAVGLVHIWAHGTAGPNGRVAALGGMPMDKIGYLPMTALRERHPLVLLNACDSALALPDDRFGPDALGSFAEVFLSHGAAGVVATVGPVGLDYSHDLLHHLLAEATDGERSVSAVLLDYRAGLARALPPGRYPDEIDGHLLRKFVYGYMYVYIGGFGTTVRLPGEEDGG